MIKIIVKFIILFINLIFLNNDINSCCCKENRNHDFQKYTVYYGEQEEQFNEEERKQIFRNQNEIVKKITLTQEQEEFSKKLNNILQKENKYDFNAEQIILLHQFTNEKGIKNINKIKIEYMHSISGCIKIDINDNICYIKKQNKSNEFFFEALKLLGLLDFKYSFTDNYVLTEHVDQNINNPDINEDYLILGKDLNPENLKNMFSKIENFKEYNFFCALLGLVNCDLIYRLDNSYFKKDGEKYKVFLLDVDSTIETRIPYENHVHTNKFYNVLARSTDILALLKSPRESIFYNFTTNENNINLIAGAIAVTIYDNSEIKYFYEKNNGIEKYSKNGTVNKTYKIIKDFCRTKDKKFIEYINNEKNDVLYRPKKKYEDTYPINIFFSLRDMFEDFVNKNPKLTEEEKGKQFLEYILPILYKTIIPEEIINPHKENNENNDNNLFTDLNSFIKKFNDVYYINKDNLYTVNNYYKAQYIIKPKIFDEIMEEKNFSDEEIKNIRQKLIKLIDFVKENGNKYNQKAVQILKNNFKFLKDNKMYQKIIKDLDL